MSRAEYIAVYCSRAMGFRIFYGPAAGDNPRVFLAVGRFPGQAGPPARPRTAPDSGTPVRENHGIRIGGLGRRIGQQYPGRFGLGLAEAAETVRLASIGEAIGPLVREPSFRKAAVAGEQIVVVAVAVPVLVRAILFHLPDCHEEQEAPDRRAGAVPAGSGCAGNGRYGRRERRRRRRKDRNRLDPPGPGDRLVAIAHHARRGNPAVDGVPGSGGQQRRTEQKCHQPREKPFSRTPRTPPTAFLHGFGLP